MRRSKSHPATTGGKFAPRSIFAGVLASAVAIAALSLLVPTAHAGTFYTSSFNIDTDHLYNSNPNGVFPDHDGYGDFGHTIVATDVVFDFPEFSLFDRYVYYLQPDLTLTLRFPRNFITLEMNGFINDDGISLGIFGVPIITKSWDEIGGGKLPPYVPGKGFRLGVAPPPPFTPPSLDLFDCHREMDYDEDGELDLTMDITSQGDYETLLEYYQYRSYTWMADQGTGIPNWFADRIQEHVPCIPLPLDWLREVDLSDFADLGAFQPPLSQGDWEHFGLDDVDLLTAYAFGPSPPTTADIIGDFDGSINLNLEKVFEPSSLALLVPGLVCAATLAVRGGKKGRAAGQ